jgi:hypothetical protein
MSHADQITVGLGIGAVFGSLALDWLLLWLDGEPP